MNQFIELKGIDPYSKDPSDCNSIYIKINNILQIENFSGFFPIIKFGANQIEQTGETKFIVSGSLVLLHIGGQRVVLDKPKDIVNIVEKVINGF